MTHLETALESLGYSSTEKQRGYIKLLHVKGALGEENPTALITDAQADVFLNRNFSSPKEALEWLNSLGQKHLLRKPGMERQQIETDARIETMRDQITPILETLGFINEVRPSRNDPEALLLLGCAQTGFIGRLNDLEGELQAGVKPETVYILGGQRALWPMAETLTSTMVAERLVAQSGGDIAATVAEIEPRFREALERPDGKDVKTKREEIVASFPEIIWPKEIDMMERAFTARQEGSRELAQVRMEKVNAEGIRPTTRDTVLKWLKDYGNILAEKRPVPVHVIVISNQPHISYQGKPVEELLPPDKFTFEVIGRGVDPKEVNLGVAFDAVARSTFAGLGIAKTKLIAAEQEFLKDNFISLEDVRRSAISLAAAKEK